MSSPTLITKSDVVTERFIGVALLCDSQGNLRAILRDDLGFFNAFQPGVPFAAMVDCGSSEKAAMFVSLVNSRGAAFDWEMNLRVECVVQPFHFAAGRMEDGLLVVGASSRSALSGVYEAAARAQQRMHWMFARPTLTVADDAVCNELSRVNNELVNAQRELARSLAQAQVLQADMNRVDEELRLSRADLEQQVAKRTQELTVSLDALRSEVACRQKAEAQFRNLSATLLRLQDEERRRIARDLHDSTGQTLAALKMSVAALKIAVERRAPTAELFDDLNLLADQALAEIRTTSHLLHPPLLEEAGFVSAARWYVEGFAKRSRIQVELQMGDAAKIPSRIEMVLFRVLQESLTNVLRHSTASKAEVGLDIGENIVLTIKDYGKGIRSETVNEFMQTGTGAGVGLAGMRERVREIGGALQIQSDSSGTTVRVAVPAVIANQRDSETTATN